MFEKGFPVSIDLPRTVHKSGQIECNSSNLQKQVEDGVMALDLCYQCHTSCLILNMEHISHCKNVVINGLGLASCPDDLSLHGHAKLASHSFLDFVNFGIVFRLLIQCYGD